MMHIEITKQTFFLILHTGGYGGLSSMATPPPPAPLQTPTPGSDPHYDQMVNDYNLRLQQQQLQLNLNMAYNQVRLGEKQKMTAK